MVFLIFDTRETLRKLTMLVNFLEDCPANNEQLNPEIIQHLPWYEKILKNHSECKVSK